MWMLQAVDTQLLFMKSYLPFWTLVNTRPNVKTTGTPRNSTAMETDIASAAFCQTINRTVTPHATNTAKTTHAISLPPGSVSSNFHLPLIQKVSVTWVENMQCILFFPDYALATS